MHYVRHMVIDVVQLFIIFERRLLYWKFFFLSGIIYFKCYSWHWHPRPVVSIDFNSRNLKFFHSHICCSTQAPAEAFVFVQNVPKEMKKHQTTNRSSDFQGSRQIQKYQFEPKQVHVHWSSSKFRLAVYIFVQLCFWCPSGATAQIS